MATVTTVTASLPKPAGREHEDWGAWSPVPVGTGCAPLGSAQRLTEELNRESFPFGLFARANDIISQCAFITCRVPLSHYTAGAEVCIRPVWPPHAAGERRIATPHETARIYDAFIDIMVGSVELTRENAVEAVESVIGLTTFSLAEDALQNEYTVWKKTLVHVVLRHAIFMSKSGSMRLSVVQLVTLGSIQITYGIRAACDIGEGTFIMESCSSVSSNTVDVEIDCRIQEIEPEMPGFSGSRIVIGPLRLARHDCRPNVTLFRIPNSSAFVLRAHTDIVRGSDITVNKRLPPFVCDAPSTACWCPSCAAIQTHDALGSLLDASVIRPISSERAAEIDLLKKMRRTLKKRRHKQNRKDRGEPAKKPGQKKRGKKKKGDGTAGAAVQNGDVFDAKATGNCAANSALSLVQAYESSEEGEI